MIDLCLVEREIKIKEGMISTEEKKGQNIAGANGADGLLCWG